MDADSKFRDARRSVALHCYAAFGASLMNDLIRLAASRAVDNFGGQGNTKNVFNGAGFSQEFVKMSPTSDQIDGHIVRMMLTGRPDIEVLSGGAHYRLVESA